MDRNDIALIALIIAASFVGGTFFGHAANNNAWEKDCQQVGMHRDMDDVYVCRPK